MLHCCSAMAQVDSKTPAEVEEYAKVFWARYKELPKWESHLSEFAPSYFHET